MNPACLRAANVYYFAAFSTAVLMQAMQPAEAAATAGGDDGVALQDLAGYRVMAAHDGWTIYFRKNSLDIWHGNVPYEHMRNGHADFAVTWKSPVLLSSGKTSVQARSAAISYIFSCSPPTASVLASVVFYGSPFVPREDTLLQQWTASRQVVLSFKTEEEPGAVSWHAVFPEDSLRHWAQAWKTIYTQSCSQ